MRLDHLLSKETRNSEIRVSDSGQYKGKRSSRCCLILRVRKDPQRNTEAYLKALRTCGGVAQLGEHLPCKQGVRSSILLISTNSFRRVYGEAGKGNANRKSHGLIAQVVRAHA